MTYGSCRVTVIKPRHDRMEHDRRPARRGDQQLDQVARADNSHQATDQQFDRPETSMTRSVSVAPSRGTA
jgi:hypothetical protein